MATRLIKACAHTSADGQLQLNMNVGVPDVDVTVVVRVMPTSSHEVDASGWPLGFFETVAGSMPTLERPSQGEFEERR